MDMIIKQFEYNGFSAQVDDEIASFTATFIEWTSDPGIMLCNCSDGQERLIPTCAVDNFKDIKDTLPEQKKTGVIFGLPSASNY